MTEYTTDNFLGGLVKLKQAKDGYRATSDAVLVASAVPAQTGQTVLDVGCGTGAVSLCLNARVKGLDFVGIDKNAQMLELAKENAFLNQCKMAFVEAEIGPSVLKGHLFNHVVTNPPFYQETLIRKIHGQAFKEELPLADWLDFCIKRLSAKGVLTVIHRADRLGEILSLINGRLGNIKVFPLWPHKGEASKRVIIQGTLGSRAPLTLLAGAVLHENETTRPEQIEKVMRSAEKLF